MEYKLKDWIKTSEPTQKDDVNPDHNHAPIFSFKQCLTPQQMSHKI